jgi:DNA polymerase V
MNTAFLTLGRRIERLCLSPEKLKITGFQSPAGDHEQGPLSIDEYVGLGSPQIWLWIADSDALAGLGIYQHDVLVVNRVGQAAPGRAAIVIIDHEFKLCSILTDAEKKCSLVTIDRQGECQRLAGQDEVVLWGIIDFLFRDLRP